jgi:hypothetical protein
MQHLTSLDTFIASNQLDSDYKNLVAFYDDFKTFKKHTTQHQSAKTNCIKYLKSAIEQKTILGINYESDIELLTKIKFEL